MKPRRVDKLAGLKAFEVKSKSGDKSLRRVYSKGNVEVESYTSLPIHEFSEYVRQDEVKEAFERMSVKLPKIV